MYCNNNVISVLKVSILSQNSYCNTISNCFYKLRNPHGTSTFETEALCLVSVQLDKQLLPCNEALPSSSLAVTHDALHYKGHTHQKLKSGRTCLIG